jgi:hypothetical protein
MERVRLYCPKCLDQIKFDAGKLTPDSTVVCAYCCASIKAGDLTTAGGQTFAQYAFGRARADVTFSGRLW